MNEDTRCDKCTFWDEQVSTSKRWGLCRRHPPAVIDEYESFYAPWPKTKPTAWCGEFKIDERHVRTFEKIAKNQMEAKARGKKDPE